MIGTRALLPDMARIAVQTVKDLGFDMNIPANRSWASFLVMTFWAMTDSGPFAPEADEIGQAVNIAIGAATWAQPPLGTGK